MSQPSEDRFRVHRRISPGACDVCGDRVGSIKGRMPGTPHLYAYCRVCARANAHPMAPLLTGTATLLDGHPPATWRDHAPQWWQAMVDGTCERLGHTDEDWVGLLGGAVAHLRAKRGAP